MGKVLSMMGRPIRDFNLESRAHKVISRDKPIPAPRHNQTEVDQLIKDQPQAYAASLEKSEILDKHLKDIFVVSKNPERIDSRAADPNRPLPLNRSCPEDYEYGFHEPTVVPKGKITLRQAMQFITNHQLKPNVYTVEKIATDYTITESTVKTILEYYKVFEVYLPEQPKSKAKFAGPSIPRKRVMIEKAHLESGLEKDKVT